MLTFLKTGDSLLMSFMKFSHIFRGLSSTRLSQFNSDTEKCKWMATDEEVEETVTDWLNGLVANFCDEGIVKIVQRLDKA
jgi:hypothetical protein